MILYFSASVKKLSTKPIKTAKELQIQVVSEDVFDDLLEEGGIFGQIKRKAICDWGTDPKVRLSHLREDLGSKGLKSQGNTYSRCITYRVLSYLSIYLSCIIVIGEFLMQLLLMLLSRARREFS